jgi:trans-aconitate 2-methyltransferase
VSDRWDPDLYLRFGDERTRPAVDLAARIRVQAPARVADLGCGPGNSTAVLRARWPEADLVGVDRSREMIDAARAGCPEGEWVLSSIEEWSSERPLDVVFSNAALQWVHDHGPLVERLFAGVAAGGALAFQIPSAEYARLRSLIHEVAHDAAWVDRMAAPLGALTMESPAFYFDHLAPVAREVDMWETEYYHVMRSHAAIVEWISSTGLRPFLDVLDSAEERRRFKELLGGRVAASYSASEDGQVLFPFRRLFVVAYA